MDWAKELHNELADATALVWKMQNALSESKGALTDEIVSYAWALHCRTGIIEGHVARWQLADALPQSD